MEKIVSEGAEPFYYHYPAAATMVTSHWGGKDNVMAAAWHSALSRQPPIYMVAISPKRFSHRLISESGEFVVNFVPYDARELVAVVGGCSGEQEDKFDRCALARLPARKVRAPVLEIAYAAYECRVVGRHPAGDHDLFMGEILAVHYAPPVYSPAKTIDVAQVKPVVYLGDDRYSTLASEDVVHLDRKALVAEVLSR